MYKAPLKSVRTKFYCNLVGFYKSNTRSAINHNKGAVGIGTRFSDKVITKKHYKKSQIIIISQKNPTEQIETITVTISLITQITITNIQINKITIQNITNNNDTELKDN